MVIMGIRSSTECVHYAVLEADGDSDVTWLNGSDERKWVFPKAATTKQAKLREAYKEFDRLVKKYAPDMVELKVAESMPGHRNTSTVRVSVEAAITLAADDNGKPVGERRYGQLKRWSKDVMNSSTVEAFVLIHIVKSPVGWETELVDALAVALRGLGR